MKRGFTLIELIGVIVILGILALIIYPIINDTFIESSENISKNQKESLENVARMWGAQNTESLSETKPYYLTIETLKRSGLLENKDIIDPDTNEEVKGCIKIEYKTNKFVYTYDIYKDVTSCH